MSSLAGLDTTVLQETRRSLRSTQSNVRRATTVVNRHAILLLVTAGTCEQPAQKLNFYLTIKI